VIRRSPLAADGQYKAQIVVGGGTRELYLPRVGRFNLDGYDGIEDLAQQLTLRHESAPPLSHGQVQTLLGAIGHFSGFSIYVPPNNAAALDWSLTPRFHLVERLPTALADRCAFACEVDVIWFQQSGDGISAVFEVETSSGTPRFFIVSNDGRRDLFSRQVQRPTFQRSGLAELTSFLEYRNVFAWHRRLCQTG
jgi:hypothetical protein